MRDAILFFGTYGAIPDPWSGNTSFLVRLPHQRILVDASGNPLQALMRAGLGPEDLTVVILTHAHPDHLYGFPSLIHALACSGRREELQVLCERETGRRARRLLEILDVDPDRPGGFRLTYKEGFHDPGVEIDLIPAVHSVPTRMVRVQSGATALLYTADTAPGLRLRESAAGCSVLVHEAAGPHAALEELREGGHSSGRQAGEAAQAAGVRRLFLCHFGTGRAYAPRRMKEEAARVFRGEIITPRPFRWYGL
jgi:ribonuclease BN (tRNA processing enzyme)